MKTSIQGVKGARDFYPEDMAVRQWLYRAIRRVSESYGYQEWDGPFLEKIDLYAAKSGEELVNQQSFVFTDRGGEPITLRPELTPSLARMVAQRQAELVFPLRWWSFGPFWRYERPQKGRSREFFQWNIDMIGVNTPESDAELVAVAAAFLREVGLSPQQVKIYINDRRLTNQTLAELGVAEALRPEALHLIDRQNKMAPEAWEANAIELGLTPNQLDGLKLSLVDEDLWKKSAPLQRIFSMLDCLGVRDYVSYDAHIIRGLDYYTAVVFEAFDVDGGRSILGGGHYDNLVSDVGGDPLPAVGFAMGDMMISVTLQKYGLAPKVGSMPDTVLATVFDEALFPASYRLAAELRQSGIKAVAYPELAKLPRQLKFADRMGILIAVIVGPDEQASRQVVVKDLARRTQQTVPYAETAGTILQLLAKAQAQ
ncbi:MAG: histidine--tRNA ligase [Anaerolineaceae bacterium]